MIDFFHKSHLILSTFATFLVDNKSIFVKFFKINLKEDSVFGLVETADDGAAADWSLCCSGGVLLRQLQLSAEDDLAVFGKVLLQLWLWSSGWIGEGGSIVRIGCFSPLGNSRLAFLGSSSFLTCSKSSITGKVETVVGWTGLVAPVSLRPRRPAANPLLSIV